MPTFQMNASVFIRMNGRKKMRKTNKQTNKKKRCIQIHWQYISHKMQESHDSSECCSVYTQKHITQIMMGVV